MNHHHADHHADHHWTTDLNVRFIKIDGTRR